MTFPTVYATRMLTTVFAKSRHRLPVSAKWIHSTKPHPITLTSILILSQLQHGLQSSSLSFGCSGQGFVCTSLLPHARYRPHSSHRPYYGIPNSTKNTRTIRTRTRRQKTTFGDRVPPCRMRVYELTRMPLSSPHFPVGSSNHRKQNSNCFTSHCFCRINNRRARGARVKSPNLKLHSEISPRPLPPLWRSFL
jgi:hypothetical protein